MRKLWLTCAISGLLFAVACGSGGNNSSNSSSNNTGDNTGNPSNSSNTTVTAVDGGVSTAGGNTIAAAANNVAPLTVDGGKGLKLTFVNYNVAYTTVTVCLPGTATCQTIDHVIVDTGSSGLRVPYGVLNSSLQSGLANVGVSAPLAECIHFVNNTFFWGSVRYADVKIGGANNDSEVAGNIPIHVMGDPTVGTSIPSACSGKEDDTVNSLGANALIGVGPYQYDCDYVGNVNGCTAAVPAGTYYTCSGGSCTNSGLAVATAQQVRNPVSAFATDNNGVIVELPAVPVGGQASVSGGSLVFGIGTEANNALANGATVLTLDANYQDAAFGGVTTVFNGASYPPQGAGYKGVGSFIDSGTPAVSFLDQAILQGNAATAGMVDCAGADYTLLYCPNTGTSPLFTQALSATNIVTNSGVANGNSRGVAFNVSNADVLFKSSSTTAASDLGGPITTGTPSASTQLLDEYFDWGMPFFYGRNVYTAIQGVTAPSGVPAGPFWAY